jgi:hypothetical protein
MKELMLCDEAALHSDKMPHPAQPKDPHMTTPNEPTRRYRISVGGDCGELLASGIEGVEVVEVESSQGGMTTVVVGLRDDAELYGLLDRLQDFALHIVSLTELTPNAA